MSNFEVGVKVDNSDAVVALGETSEAVENLEWAAVDANKEIEKSFKKSSIAVNAFRKISEKTGKRGKVVFDKIEKGAGKVKKKLVEWRVEAIALGNSMKGPLKAGLAGATVAVTALVGALTVAGVQGVETADILQKLSDTTAISVENVSAYYTAIKKGGGDVDGAKDSLNDFVERIGDARSGSGAFQEAFKALGVDINGPIDKALQDSIKTLSEMDNQSDALFRGIEVFGNEYKLVADQVRSGNNILEESPLFSPEYIKASRELTVNLNKMKVSFMTTLNKGLEPFVIAINDMFKAITEDDIQRFANGTIDAFKAVIKAGAILFTALDTVFSGWNMLIQSSVTSLTRYVSTWNATASKMLGMAVNWAKAMNAIKPGQFFDVDTSGAEELSASLLATSEEYAQSTDLSSSRTAEIINGTNSRTEALAKLIEAMDKLAVSTEDANNAGTGGGKKKKGDKKERTGKSYTQILIEEDLALRDAWEIDKEAKRRIAEENELAHQEAMKQIAQDIGMSALNAVSSITSSIAQIRQNSRDAELASMKAQQDAELRGLKMSSAAKYAIEKKNAVQEAKIREESAEKNKKLRIFEANIGLASGVAGAWSNAMQLPYPANIIAGSATSALLTGVTIPEIAAIKSESYATGLENGPIGGGFKGASNGPDNTTINAKNGEGVINGAQQKYLFDAIANNRLGGTVNLNIESLTADEEGLDRLEERLYSLQSAGRFQFS